MEKNQTSIVIESRIQLFEALAEAAETEHNLMCLYLYAMFGLKRSVEEGVTAKELTAIEGWRKIVMGVSLEEMSHLSLVANLFSALGGTPHFSRPNFPASPGLYPSDMVIELAPFDMRTIDHFIFLERPASQELKDGESFIPVGDYQRVASHDRLMPSAGDYKTVGELYRTIREALIDLSKDIGEAELFCGSIDRQITPVDSPLRGLIAIKDLESALKAIDTIIEQGEGATTIKGSHFERFCTIKTEYEQILKDNPQFEPGRKVARNPVMRKPLSPEGRVWVNHPISARYIDLANAFYIFMLKILVQVYLVGNRDRNEKHEMLQMSFTVMHMLAVVGETLTLLPSSDETPDCFAGMSFAMVRSLTPLSKETELDIMNERLEEFSVSLKNLQGEIEKFEEIKPLLGACVDQLCAAHAGIEKLKVGVVKLKQARDVNGSAQPAKMNKDKDASNRNIPQSECDVETAESSEIKIQFNSKKCIHTRHCVTELPGVFKANTPGKWLFPENASADLLAAVVRECPSGALTYTSKGALKNEEIPPVNVMRVYENGPYAFLSDLVVDGKKECVRATLCRCGQSKRKPYCDHSHAEVGFIASGEPETIDDKALEARDGALLVERTNDGPLSVKGNLEICANTGRIILRTSDATLCRCGHSRTKPLCDSTHSVIGFRDAVAQK